MTALVTKHLPLVAGAPDGIKKLRALILELAVRGKLVQQQATDEPAITLLKRIDDENDVLVAQGRIKKKRILSRIELEEVPYEVPTSWAWVRLGNLFEIVYGKGLSTSELTQEGYLVFGANGIIGRYPSYIYSEPQLLVSCRGAYSGKANISPPNCFVTSNSLVLQSSWKFLSLKFFYYSLTIANKEKIVTGSAQPQVTTTNLEPFLVALPPIQEQHRIVAKVDELMALCDRLEADQADAEAAHAQLVQALLDSLTQATDAADFRASWQRLSEHFHTLFTTVASIDALKQTVLQLAVMGKLVKQDLSAPEDGQTALEKIIAWRKQALIGKEIREPRSPVKVIGIEEHPYELPDGWAWVRLGTLIYIHSGDGLTAANMRAGTIPVFGGNGINGYHDECNVVSPTLVIGRVGYYCGSIHVTPENAWVTDNAFITKFCADAVDIRFLYWLLKITNLKENDSATAQPVISGSKIYPIVVGLPPLEEQRRIVTKVDELMSLCDQLKAHVSEARQDHEQLAQALVEQAIS